MGQIENSDFRFTQLSRLHLEHLAKCEPLDIQHQIRIPTQIIDARHGFIFAACGCTLTCWKTVQLENLNQQKVLSKLQKQLYRSSDEPGCEPHLKVALDSWIVWLAVNGPGTVLVACVYRSSGIFALMFDLAALVASEVILTPFVEVRLTLNNTEVLRGLAWNPEAATDQLLICTNNGRASLFSINLCSSPTTFSLIGQLGSEKQVRAVCWSRKGKQMVIALIHSLEQYDTQFQRKRVIDLNAPLSKIISTGETWELSEILWTSTFTFFVALQSKESYRCALVTALKDSSIQVNDLDEPCFCIENEAQSQSTTRRGSIYYLRHLPEWNLVLCLLSRSNEVAVIELGNEQDVPRIWLLDDTARAVVPMSEQHRDTFPMGMALDYCPSQIIPALGTNHSPAIWLLIITSVGHVCLFAVNYTNSTATSLLQQTPILKPLTNVKSQPVSNCVLPATPSVPLSTLSILHLSSSTVPVTLKCVSSLSATSIVTSSSSSLPLFSKSAITTTPLFSSNVMPTSSSSLSANKSFEDNSSVGKAFHFGQENSSTAFTFGTGISKTQAMTINSVSNSSTVKSVSVNPLQKSFLSNNSPSESANVAMAAHLIAQFQAELRVICSPLNFSDSVLHETLAILRVNLRNAEKFFVSTHTGLTGVSEKLLSIRQDIADLLTELGRVEALHIALAQHENHNSYHYQRPQALLLRKLEPRLCRRLESLQHLEMNSRSALNQLEDAIETVEKEKFCPQNGNSLNPIMHQIYQTLASNGSVLSEQEKLLDKLTCAAEKLRIQDASEEKLNPESACQIISSERNNRFSIEKQLLCALQRRGLPPVLRNSTSDYLTKKLLSCNVKQTSDSEITLNNTISSPKEKAAAVDICLASSQKSSTLIALLNEQSTVKPLTNATLAKSTKSSMSNMLIPNKPSAVCTTKVLNLVTNKSTDASISSVNVVANKTSISVGTAALNNVATTKSSCAPTTSVNLMSVKAQRVIDTNSVELAVKSVQMHSDTNFTFKNSETQASLSNIDSVTTQSFSNLVSGSITASSIAGTSSFASPIIPSKTVGGLFGTSTIPSTTVKTNIGGAVSLSTECAVSLIPSGNTAVTTSAKSDIFCSTTISSQTENGIFTNTIVVPSTTTTSGLFGSNETTTVTKSNIFGSASAPLSAGNGLFGSASAPSTTKYGLFGNTSSPSTIGHGIFGSAGIVTTASSLVVATATGSSLFDSTAVTITTTSGIFGSPVFATGNRLFSSTEVPSATGNGFFSRATENNVFGVNDNASSVVEGLVGGISGLPSGNVFGTTIARGLFDNSTGVLTSGANVFGNSTGSSIATGNISAGSTNSSASGGLFGGNSNSSTSGTGLFDNKATGLSVVGNTFFGSNTSVSSSTSENFGGNFSFNNSSGVFGKTSFSGSNVFNTGVVSGNQPPASGSLFSSPPLKSGVPAFGGAPVFGGSPSFCGNVSFSGTSFGCGQVFGEAVSGINYSTQSIGFGELAGNKDCNIQQSNFGMGSGNSSVQDQPFGFRGLSGTSPDTSPFGQSAFTQRRV